MAHGDMVITLEHATSADADEILVLYRSQIGQGTSDWDEIYPDMECITHDLAENVLYIWRESGRIGAAASLHATDDLDELDCWTPAHSCIPSRLCVARDLQGRHIAESVINALYAIARSQGYTAMRLLCSKTNSAAIRLYERMGFAVRGECNMYEIDFFCFEKLF